MNKAKHGACLFLLLFYHLADSLLLHTPASKASSSIKLHNSPDDERTMFGLSSLEGFERTKFKARETLERKYREFEEKGQCSRCFMTRSCCICRIIQDSYIPKVKTKVVVFMHYKEFGRASNTGTLLGLTLDAPVFIYGRGNDIEDLSSLLLSEKGVILYPSSDSLSISSLANSDQESNSGSISTVCLIDSSWRQAPSMNRALSSAIPRINVDKLVAKKSEFISRKQHVNGDKISTIEAAILALQHLGEHKEGLDLLSSALRLRVDALKVQSGYDQVYGNNFARALGSGKGFRDLKRRHQEGQVL